MIIFLQKLFTKKNKIKRCKEENEQLKVKVTDLESNIELLVNNSNDTKIKELVQTAIENQFKIKRLYKHSLINIAQKYKKHNGTLKIEYSLSWKSTILEKVQNI